MGENKSYFIQNDMFSQTWGFYDVSWAITWKVKFANGNIIISPNDTEWFQFQLDAGFDTYIVTDKLCIQYSLYRFCDVEDDQPLTSEVKTSTTVNA